MRDARTPAVPPAAAGGLLALLLALPTWSSPVAAQQVPSDPATVRERADVARVKGRDDAPIQLLEISDFQCPFCAEFYRNTLSELERLYIDTGKVRYVFIVYPSPEHQRAWPAAEAAFCAGAVGKFWPMHDLLFERQERWAQAANPTELFVSYASELAIEESSFRACLEEDRPASLQVSDTQWVVQQGIQATPFFVIDNEIALEGAAPLQQFRTVLDSILTARGQ